MGSNLHDKSLDRILKLLRREGFEFVKAWDIPNTILNEVKACSENLLKGRNGCQNQGAAAAGIPLF